MQPRRKKARMEGPALNGKADAQEPDQDFDNADPIKLARRDGDVIIVLADNKKLLVSSKILSQASDVFCARFSGNWPEAIKLKAGETIVVDCKDDDAQSMEMILGILHWKVPDMSHVTSGHEARLYLAICSDYYDLTEALNHWIDTKWLPQFHQLVWRKSLTIAKSRCKTPLDFGMMLVTTFLFKDRCLPKLAVKVAAVMEYGWLAKWEDAGLLNYLPDKFISTNHEAEALYDYAEDSQVRLAAITKNFYKSLNRTYQKVLNPHAQSHGHVSHGYQQLHGYPVLAVPVTIGYQHCDGPTYRPVNDPFDDDRVGLMQRFADIGCVGYWWCLEFDKPDFGSIACDMKPGTIAEIEERFEAARNLLSPHKCTRGLNCYLGLEASQFLCQVAWEIEKFRTGSVTEGLTWL